MSLASIVVCTRILGLWEVYIVVYSIVVEWMNEWMNAKKKKEKKGKGWVKVQQNNTSIEREQNNNTSHFPNSIQFIFVSQYRMMILCGVQQQQQQQERFGRFVTNMCIGMFLLLLEREREIVVVVVCLLLWKWIWFWFNATTIYLVWHETWNWNTDLDHGEWIVFFFCKVRLPRRIGCSLNGFGVYITVYNCTVVLYVLCSFDHTGEIVCM